MHTTFAQQTDKNHYSVFCMCLCACMGICGVCGVAWCVDVHLLNLVKGHLVDHKKYKRVEV